MSMLRLMALAAAALSLAADVEPAAKLPKADVRGVVKDVGGLRAKDYVGRMTVEGKKEADTSYDAAVVLMKNDTKFYRWAGGKKTEAKFGDIANGCTVQCVFTGGVDDSKPVQAQASEVIILAPAKK